MLKELQSLLNSIDQNKKEMLKLEQSTQIHIKALDKILDKIKDQPKNENNTKTPDHTGTNAKIKQLHKPQKS